MKQLSIFLIFFLFTSLNIKSQNILTVKINNLKSNTGKVLLKLKDGENKFVKGISSKIVNNTCLFTIKDLKVGEYSFKYFHDENNNKKLDTNFIGMPTEG